MENQRAQSELLLGNVGEVRAVDPAAHADDAVEVFARASFLYGIDNLLELTLTAFVGVPVGEDLGVVCPAMVAYSLLIESDGRIGRVHHAIGADLIRAALHSGIQDAE